MNRQFVRLYSVHSKDAFDDITSIQKTTVFKCSNFVIFKRKKKSFVELKANIRMLIC